MAEPYYIISSAGGTVLSNEIASEGIGVELNSNLTGMGLPPVSAQFDEGLGDGATYRGTRVLQRALDFNAHCYAPTRPQLRSIVDRFSMVLAHPCTVTFVDPDENETWSVTAYRTGGGDYNYGSDSDAGKTFVNFAWTMQTDSPFWKSDTISRFANVEDIVRTDNHGTHEGRAIWRVTGPTNGFTITDEDDNVLEFGGFIPQGQTVTVDGTTGQVYDSVGANRYADVGRLNHLTIPPGDVEYVFGWDQTSLEFTEHLTRTNFCTNPSFRSNPATHGGFTVPGVYSWNSSDTRIWMRDRDAATTTKPIFKCSVSGLTVGKTYVCTIKTYQELSLTKNDDRLSGWVRVKDSSNSIIASETVPWSSSRTSLGGTVTFVAYETTATFEFRAPLASYTGSAGSAKYYEGIDGFAPAILSLYIGEPGDYFDGSTTDVDNVVYAWTGTADQSTSTETTEYTTEFPIEGEGLACEVEFRAERWLAL